MALNTSKTKKPTIGDLREVGIFEGNTSRVKYTGGYVDGYTNIITAVRCKLRQINGKRTNEFGEIVITSYWEMTCRFQNVIDESIKVNTKFVVGNKKFTVASFTKIDENDFYYFFTLFKLDA
jgi:hypothetical protein